MLLNAYFLAKFRFDTAENEPAKKNCKIYEKIAGSTPTLPWADRGDRHQRRRRGARRRRGRRRGRSVCQPLRQRRDLGKFRQNVARFRLYRRRSLQEHKGFAAFFKIYQII